MYLSERWARSFTLLSLIVNLRVRPSTAISMNCWSRFIHTTLSSETKISFFSLMGSNTSDNLRNIAGTYTVSNTEWSVISTQKSWVFCTSSLSSIARRMRMALHSQSPLRSVRRLMVNRANDVCEPNVSRNPGFVLKARSRKRKTLWHRTPDTRQRTENPDWVG